MFSRRIPRWVGWPLLAVWTYLVFSFFAERSKFHPARYPEGLWDLQRELGAEDVWLRTSDGVRIHGWFLAAGEQARWVTLYFHGNAGNLSHRIRHMEALRRVGSDLLLIDYRGYGRSEGTAAEPGIYRDADAAYAWLRGLGRSWEKIVLYGESLGTAVAADLAAREACAGVVLEAPFPSAKAVAARVLPFIGPLVVSGLDTAANLRRVRVPVLILHGNRDEVIPQDLGREVFEAANEPKEFWGVEGANHSDILEVAGREYLERLRAFYEGLG
jgi:pimeloyl-ACP methyl ester carboxylesterase